MKIALPTRESKVDDHFGHCEYYTIFTINDDHTIATKENMPSPEGCGCKSNIAPILASKGVSIMLAGSMGMGAVNVLANSGIKVYGGCSGNVEEVVKNFLAGKITETDVHCAGHEEGHVCNHH
ncbi:MAG: NifB/NifX family molybdenum-iron cluster-binding protein [Bacteroidales bacterium]